MPETKPRFRDRFTNALLGRKNPESGQREGGVAGLFRDASGDYRDPVSATGDRVGRGVAGWVNNRIHDYRYDNYMDDLYAQEGAARPVMTQPGRPRYGVPDSLRPSVEQQGPPSSLQNPWQQLPDYTAGRTEMTEAERQQQREQFDRYKDDPNSIYYQGPNFDRMRTPDQIVGPNAHNHVSQTRDMYDAYDTITSSGGGFADAVARYGALQRPNRNTQR